VEGSSGFVGDASYYVEGASLCVEATSVFVEPFSLQTVITILIIDTITIPV
jgi:hypothetical protein